MASWQEAVTELPGPASAYQWHDDESDLTSSAAESAEPYTWQALSPSLFQDRDHSDSDSEPEGTERGFGLQGPRFAPRGIANAFKEGDGERWDDDGAISERCTERGYGQWPSVARQDGAGAGASHGGVGSILWFRADWPERLAPVSAFLDCTESSGKNLLCFHAPEQLRCWLRSRRALARQAVLVTSWTQAASCAAALVDMDTSNYVQAMVVIPETPEQEALAVAWARFQSGGNLEVVIARDLASLESWHGLAPAERKRGKTACHLGPSRDEKTRDADQKFAEDAAPTSDVMQTSIPEFMTSATTAKPSDMKRRRVISL